jgi:uncharacterized protein YjiS (DUF1127 family)
MEHDMINHLARGFMIETRDKSSFGLVERLCRHYARRAARRELRALDDRMLSDIGISRGEIERVTKG